MIESLSIAVHAFVSRVSMFIIKTALLFVYNILNTFKDRVNVQRILEDFC